MKKLILVTDAWSPQVNGVVTSLQRVCEELQKKGIEIIRISPEQFLSVPCPSYPEIRLCFGATRKIKELFNSTITHRTDVAIHIATEGPLGMAARRICIQKKYAFTTAYHTRFPEYIKARWGVPVSWTERGMKWFHGPSQNIMVSTKSLYEELYRKGYRKLALWTRGVDTELFRPRPELLKAALIRSFLVDKYLEDRIFLYVGRVAVEKNIEAFLKIKTPGLKVIVGDGPQREELQNKYPHILFTGVLKGELLAGFYSIADLFVFPSLTDTFGLVLLEALASGVPILSFPVAGPKDVLGTARVGVMAADLEEGVRPALNLSREKCREFALRFSWQVSADQFAHNLVSTENELTDVRPWLEMPGCVRESRGL